MQISTKGRYAMCVMLDLAEHQADGYIALKDIAQRQNISKKYLEQIVAMLNKSDILKATRGSNGGYMLAKNPSKYTVGMILKLTEGSLEAVSSDTDVDSDAALNSVWSGLNETIDNYLESITLQDILDRKRASYSNDYII